MLRPRDRRILLALAGSLALLALGALGLSEWLTPRAHGLRPVALPPAGHADLAALERSLLLMPLDHSTPAPDIELPRVDGGSLRLGQLRGRVVVLNFWATWCPPCRPEKAALERLYQALGPRGVSVVAIAHGEAASEVRPVVAELGITYPVLVDESGRIGGGAYAVSALPTTVVIDPAGRLVARAVGPREWDGAVARALFTRLLADAAPDR